MVERNSAPRAICCGANACASGHIARRRRAVLFGGGERESCTHPHVELAHGPLGVEAVEGDLRGRDAYALQPEQYAHFFDELAAIDGLALEQRAIVVL